MGQERDWGRAQEGGGSSLLRDVCGLSRKARSQGAGKPSEISSLTGPEVGAGCCRLLQGPRLPHSMGAGLYGMCPERQRHIQVRPQVTAASLACLRGQMASLPAPTHSGSRQKGLPSSRMGERDSNSGSVLEEYADQKYCCGHFGKRQPATFHQKKNFFFVLHIQFCRRVCCF